VAAKIGIVLLVAACSLVAGRTAFGKSPFRGGVPHLVLSSTKPLYDVSGASVGDSRTGSVRVTNDGKGSGRVFMSALTNGSRPLMRQLSLLVKANGRAVYNGSLADMGRVDLGLLAPGESRLVTVRIALRDSANSRQANRVETSFSWVAVAA
jgi:hypothetical protein